MFGYISPDTPYLFKKDERLYGAVYCGLCKCIGKGCGQCPRTALSYDLAFTSALVHNIRGEDVKIENRRCILHWFKRRPIAAADGLTVTLGCANTILTYFKLCDDKADGDGRAALRHFYKGGYKRAKRLHPGLCDIVGEGMAAQAALEKAGCAVLDEAAEPTAVMMEKLSNYVLGEFATPYTQKLFYCLGKWVYLIDALDDYDKDVKKGRYNVLFNTFQKTDKKELVEFAKEDLKFALNILFAQMRECLANIKFYFNHDLTDNIILRGIPLKSREIFYGKRCVNGKGAVSNEQEES